MAFSSFSLSNFKGFSTKTTFDIKPLTIFLGPNSSGKSSFIHALATLSQTASVPNANVPLLLDHEYADVHLGRFIDVIHTKKYTDSISFELVFTNYKLEALTYIKNSKPVSGKLTIDISYKSTLRTQEIFLNHLNMSIGDLRFEVRRVKNSQKYDIVNISEKRKFRAIFEKPFMIGFPEVDSQETVEDFFRVREILSFLDKELQAIYYLGPFRQSPKRMYPFRGGAPDNVGPEGEMAIPMIANEYISSQSKIHTKQISKWLSDMGLAKDITLSRQGKSDLFNANLTLNDGKNFSIADLGYGLSQILPVLTQCTFAKKNSVLLFEQPEIHLHSIAARKLPSVFIETIKPESVSL